jgi:hypothetical protein
MPNAKRQQLTIPSIIIRQLPYKIEKAQLQQREPFNNLVLEQLLFQNNLTKQKEARMFHIIIIIMAVMKTSRKKLRNLMIKEWWNSSNHLIREGRGHKNSLSPKGCFLVEQVEIPGLRLQQERRLKNPLLALKPKMKENWLTIWIWRPFGQTKSKGLV